MPPLQCNDLKLSGQREDLDEANHLLIEETSLSLDCTTRNEIHWQTLRELGLALARLYRSKTFGELEDINITIKYLRSLHKCPLEAFSVPRHAVTTSLVEMLAARVKGDSSDPLEDINEILFFCRGLTSAASPGYLISALQALTQAVLDAYSRDKQIQPFDQAIGCLREVLKTRSPDLHRVSLDLANLLAVRFLVLHIDNDYEEAKVLLDRVTNSLSLGDSPCSCRFEASAVTAALGHARSVVNSNVEDFENAISRCRSFLENSPLFGDPLDPVISELLMSNVEQASKDFIPPQDEQAAHSEVDFLPTSTELGIFQVVDGSDGRDVVPTLLPMSLEEAIDLHRGIYSKAGIMTECQRKHLQDLVLCLNTKIFRTQDTTSLEEAIAYNRRLRLLDRNPTEDPGSKFIHGSNFAILLYAAFVRTEKAGYLDESITLFREVLQLDTAQLTDYKFTLIKWLIESLSTRIEWRKHRVSTFAGSHDLDLDELFRQFTSGVKDTPATVPSRFELACQWAKTAQEFEHHSLLTAYENAMSLMQSSVVFGPTLPIQHDRLVERRSLYEKMPLDYASYHLSSGQLKRAIETLEQGRSLLWSEMRGLRISTDQLRAADPVLADTFTAINKELEMILTSSALSNGSVGLDDGRCEGDKWMTLLPGLTARQQELLKAQDALITKIRALPDLRDFLLLPFDTLRSAASHGPIIIINHCELRSDILIVLHDDPPSLISTHEDFFKRSRCLKNQLLNARENYDLESKHYEDALSSVLKGLYELVGKPVVERLNELEIAHQSRVWWCPTSDFWNLPLHAMGPISSDGGVACYFSDLYISSYTPTLSALTESRSLRPGAQTSAHPTLLIAKPNQSPPGAWPDTLVERGPNLQTTSVRATSGNMTSDTVLDGLQQNRFAHVAYDGRLETAKPFDAALVDCNRECLDMLDVVRSRLPAGEFVFLPGSHTAELTDKSIPDEALHFSTAVQYSGFRSVIGTMWKVDDVDGQNLAKHFYPSMFSTEPYYEKSAEALQYAVQQIRPGLPLARWVSYVHYGA
jgi:CHAT domain-containing protein